VQHPRSVGHNRGRQGNLLIRYRGVTIFSFTSPLIQNRRFHHLRIPVRASESMVEYNAPGQSETRRGPIWPNLALKQISKEKTRYCHAFSGG